MSLLLILQIISKSLAALGLVLDIYGVFKLFELEPKALDEANENIFEATIGNWTEIEQVKYIASELNKNVQELRFESGQLKRNSKKFKNIIILGFILQFVSIILSF